MSSALKCYLIDTGDTSGLYFAATPGRAKAHAAAENDADITGIVSCRRRPQYDQYAPGPVPPRALMDDGWWFECYGCSRQVYGDEEEDDDGNVLTPVFDGTYVWCSGICRARDAAREARRKLEEAEMRVAVEIAVNKKFPGLRVGHAWQPYHRPQPMCQLFLEDLHIADWEIGSPDVFVAPINLAAWNDYEDKRFSHRQIEEWEWEGGFAAA